MNERNPFSDMPDDDLPKAAEMKHPGPAIEATLRLKAAVEKQSRASGRLTWAIIALMLVQILVATIAIVKVQP
jgi:hypothetical protein